MYEALSSVFSILSYQELSFTWYMQNKYSLMKMGFGGEEGENSIFQRNKGFFLSISF